MLFFYDYETFGKNTSLDRPAQFAGVLTDNLFKIKKKPTILYCCLLNDYLPDPESILIHGITPQYTFNHGINEEKFAKKIYQLLKQKNTCVLGYNNIKFDDEITRNLFYRNFYDPYSWSWQLGNSRWDLLNVVRAYYAIQPRGIKWPMYENNLPNLKLSYLAKENNINCNNAHNAIYDVYTTIELAKFLYKIQPKLFKFLYYYRDKKRLKTLINLIKIKPLIYIDNIIGAKNNFLTYVVPLIWHPTNKNAIIACNLNSKNFCKFKIFNKIKINNDKFSDKNIETENIIHYLPLITIYLNKCPILIPVNFINKKDIEHLNINIKLCRSNLIWLYKNQEIKKKIELLFNNNNFKFSDDVDQQLYCGFFNNHDRNKMDIIRNTLPKNINKIKQDFNDTRIKQLLFRYRARNFTNLLNEEEKLIWKNHCKKKFTINYFEEYINNIKKLKQIYKKDNYRINLLLSIYNYIKKYKNNLYNNLNNNPFN